VVFEDGAQELGNGKNVLGMTDLLEDVRIEPFGKQPQQARRAKPR
jgi:hypothetical protein